VTAPSAPREGDADGNMPYPRGMDKDALLSEIHRRNEIRREAKLPILDVDRELEFAVNDALWREFLETCERHAGDRARIRAEFVAERRAKDGPDWGNSAGGRWVIEHHTTKRFHAFLAELGHIRPQYAPRHAVVYGEAKDASQPSP